MTPLQERLLDAFRGLEGVYLSGGAALGHFYLGHRRSLDLDLFMPERERLEEAAARLMAFCDNHGLAVSEERRYPGFRRFEVASSSETTKVELVHEPTRQTVPVAQKPNVDGLRVDAPADLVANKLGAVLGRADPKDLVDLYFLAQAGYDLLAHLPAARERDAGLDPATLAWVLASTPPDPSDLMLLVPVDPDELRRFRDALIERLQLMAWPGGRSK